MNSALLGAAFDLSFCIGHVAISVKRVPIDVPVQTSFGIMQDRPAVFVLARDVHGNEGLGEVWCNFPTCGAEHRAILLKTTILPALLNKKFSDPQTCFAAMEKHFEKLVVQTGEFGPIAQCLSGLDIAIWDLVARRAGVPLYHLLGGTSPQIDVYTSGINPTGALENVRRMKEAGHTAFKLKIGFG